MAEGWIKLHRKLLDCILWIDEEPFDRRSAWIDLLLLANHSDKEILFNGSPITIKRGQYLTSVRKLAEHWHWSANRTLRFLRLLESLKMITKESDNYRTLLTIENYGVYQDMWDTNGYTDGYADEHTDGYTDGSQTIKKECKKEINKDIKGTATKKFVPPTLEEVKAYCVERNNNVDPERWFDFYSAKGWMVGSNKMKDWKAAVRTWEKSDKKGAPKSEPKKSGNGFNNFSQTQNYDMSDLEKQILGL